jgi:anaerobic magnesium-protoporphyrin IX monomethyl ester cyclase
MPSVPDILLVFPPFWDTGSPYLSVPTLAAWLRRAEIRVEAIDLNRRCTERLLTAEAMTGSLRIAEQMLRDRPAGLSEDHRHEFAANLELCRTVWDAAGDRLIAPFQPSTEPAGVEDYTALRRRLGWAFNIASTPYYPIRLDGLSGTDALSRLSAVCELAESGIGAPGLRFAGDFAREHATRAIPLVGISIAGPSQLAPALLIARMFKAHAPMTFVCVGGPQVPYIAAALAQYHRPFDWVDAFVPGEGELPLADLTLAIREGRDPSTVRGLLVLRGQSVLSTGEPGRVDIAKLPVPDFTDFEPWRYIGNDLCLPLTFSRGCSWGRCSFCTQHICFDGYRAMAPKQIEDQIGSIMDRFGIRSLAINDENLTPGRLRDLAEIAGTSFPNVRWQALARLAPELADPELARELAESGCVMLSMGLESGDQGVLDTNRKGIRVEQVPSILRALHEAGIWLNVFLIFGLPGETPETAMHTVEFVQANLPHFDSLSPTVFRVERGSPIAVAPERFGIVLTDVPLDHCDSEIPVSNSPWLTKPEAMVCVEGLINGLLGAPQCPIEQADLNGQFVLQMLADVGIEALRAEMQARADATDAAADLIEYSTEAYREWWGHIEAEARAPDDAGETRVILSLPDRGTFFTLTPHERLLFRLRALGPNLDDLQRGFGMLLEDEVERARMQWGVTASVILLLSSRLPQESLRAEDSLQVLRLDPSGRLDAPASVSRAPVG